MLSNGLEREEYVTERTRCPISEELLRVMRMAFPAAQSLLYRCSLPRDAYRGDHTAREPAFTPMREVFERSVDPGTGRTLADNRYLRLPQTCIEELPPVGLP